MANVSDLRHALAARVAEIATQALELTYRETVAEAPSRTGRLRELIDTSRVDMVSEFVASAEIFCMADYAEYTDAGSVPHQIPGRPWLAFFWERENADVVFSHRDGHEPAYVNHPGTAGTQWFNSGISGGDPMASRWARFCAAAA